MAEMTKREFMALSDRAKNEIIAQHFGGWQWVQGHHFDVTAAEPPMWLLPPGVGVGDVGPGCWTYAESKGLEPQSPVDPHHLTIWDVPDFMHDIKAAWDVADIVTQPPKERRVGMRSPQAAFYSWWQHSDVCFMSADEAAGQISVHALLAIGYLKEEG